MPQLGTASRKLVNGTRRAVRNPGWLGENLRGKLRARRDRGRPFSLADHAEHCCGVGEALSDAFGISADEYHYHVALVRIPSSPDGPSWGGWSDMLYLTGALVRVRRPRVAIETGVARGFTTSVILEAMDENGVGALHSIDLPPLQVDASAFVGSVVREELKQRWTLHVGPSRSILPGLARQVAPIDLFIHDSDHSYPAQYEEYRQVWPHLALGGCVISDDVYNPAFTDFAHKVGERPYLIAPPGRDAAVGLLVKTG